MAGTLGSANDPSSLTRLLDTEVRLEALLSGARAEAATLVQDAQAEAQRRITALQSELAEAAAGSERTLSDDCAERLAKLTGEHQVAMEALRSITPARIGELSSWVSRQVLDGTLDGSGS